MAKHLKLLVFFAVTAAATVPAGAWANEFPWLYERKIIGENNLRAVEDAFGTPSYEFARSIARTEFVGTQMPFCTASRVGKNLFLTNFHCDNDCSVMQFTMGVEKSKPEAERLTFVCKELVRSVEMLDYALFIAEPVDDTLEHEYPILTLSDASVEMDQKLLVASHPSGRAKELDDSDECVISETVPFMTESGRNTIKHMCDTEGGSSGSPVLDRETGHIVALHWGGRSDQFNLAIPMALIVQDLRDNVSENTFTQLSVSSH